MFYGEKNNGAFFNNQRVRVSKKTELSECLFVTGGKLMSDYEFTYRKSGSAALDLAYVAAGRYDGYFQKNLNIWDIAAGIIILKEAGGILNEIDLTNNSGIDIIGTNSNIFSKLKGKLLNF